MPVYEYLCNDCGPFDNAVEVLGTFAELSD